MQLGQIKMCSECKIHTGFGRVSTEGKNVNYLVNDFCIDDMLKRSFLDKSGSMEYATKMKITCFFFTCLIEATRKS